MRKLKHIEKGYNYLRHKEKKWQRNKKGSYLWSYHCVSFVIFTMLKWLGFLKKCHEHEEKNLFDSIDNGVDAPFTEICREHQTKIDFNNID